MPALSAGHPQIFVPTQMESRLMADCVVARGCGHLLTGHENTAHSLARVIRGIATDLAMAERAVEVSHEIRARGPQEAVEQTITACASVLQASSDANARVGIAQ